MLLFKNALAIKFTMNSTSYNKKDKHVSEFS